MIKSNLHILLSQKKLKQNHLAKMINVRPNTISDIINNSMKQYPVEALDKICQALDCNIGDILYYEPDDNDYEINKIDYKYI